MLRTRRRKIIFIAAAGTIVILMLVLAGIKPDLVTLRIDSNVEASAQVGTLEGDVPGDFAVPEGEVPVLVSAPGYCSSLVSVLVGKDPVQQLSVVLAECPEPGEATLSPFCTFPSFVEDKQALYYLGNRGASIVSLDRAGGGQVLNDDKLAQVTSVTWSAQGNQALLRVEPAGDSLYTLGSPVACQFPSTFLYGASSNSFQQFHIPIAHGSSFNRDGSRVYFGTMEENSSVIVDMSLDNPALLTGYYTGEPGVHDLGANILVPYCYAGPDGRFVAFTPTPDENRMSTVDLSILDTETDQIIDVTSTGHVYGATWSPDGRFLVFEYRDPSTGLPTLLAYDIAAGGLTRLALNTYLDKLTWYSDSVFLAGYPNDIEKALKEPVPTTPDALVYCSAASGRFATVVPSDSDNPQHYTNPTLAYDNQVLYYTQSLFLKNVDISTAQATITAFQESQEKPIEPEAVRREAK